MALSMRLRGAQIQQRLQVEASQGQGNEKKAKIDQPKEATEAPRIRRDRLAELMRSQEIAAQQAPLHMPGRQARPVAGGLQEHYLNSLRRYLADASLAQTTRGSADSPTINVVVLEVHESAEGLLIFGEVLDRPDAQGSVLRILLHRCHPACQQGPQAVPSRGFSPGVVMQIRGIVVGSDPRSLRGQIVLPLEVTFPTY